jgi:hypothetical protein
MCRCLAQLLFPLVVTGAFLFPANLHAQPLAPPPPDPAAGPGQKEERSPPVFAWALALVASLLVLLIVCMPTRKA